MKRCAAFLFDVTPALLKNLGTIRDCCCFAGRYLLAAQRGPATLGVGFPPLTQAEPPFVLNRVRAMIAPIGNTFLRLACSR